MASHLDVTHFILSKHVRKGDTVIDATCGNGNDAQHLANLALTHDTGNLHCIDIQLDAINSTKKRLHVHPQSSRIVYHHGSHDNLPSCSPSTIVYNLGYLPGGDKSLTTMVESTFSSFEKALEMLRPGGALFITFYPGHPEGIKELEYAEHWHPKIESAGFKIFLYKHLSDRFSPQLWIIKKPFQKNRTANI